MTFSEHPPQDSAPHESAPQESAPTLPTELAPLDRWLTADGAAWRRQVPSHGPLDAHVRQLAALPAPAPLRGEQETAGRTAMIGGSTRAVGTRRSAGRAGVDFAGQRRRWPAAAGVLAAAALVALFAGLLYGMAPRISSSPPPMASPRPTAVQTSTAWQVFAGLRYFVPQNNELGGLAFAPSDPRTVYLALSHPLTLRRTTDDGQTWQTLALPGDPSAVDRLMVFVSPLDARTVFIQFFPSAASETPALYRSTNGGDTWQAVQLPVAGGIAEPEPAPILPFNSFEPLLYAQGSRLFAIAGCVAWCGSPSPTVIVSADGGATWTVTDTAIRAAGQEVCQDAVSSTGGNVFALTAAAGSCGASTFPPEELWQSADDGADWTLVAHVSGTVAFPRVAPRAGNAPLLYALFADITLTSTGYTESGQSLKASADGGRTWQPAPMSGIPSTLYAVSKPLGVLSDGTVLMAFSASRDESIYGWRAGEAAWHQVTPPTAGPIDTFTIVPDPGGSDTLLAEVSLSSTQTGATLEAESFVVAG